MASSDWEWSDSDGNAVKGRGGFKPLNKGGSISRSKYGGFAIDIEGLAELGADLENLGKNGLRQAIRQALRGAGGEALAAEQRMRAPIRTGELVAGIRVHHADEPGADVLVGYKGELPKGEWAESGVRPHMIETSIKTVSVKGPLGRTTHRYGTDKSALSFDGQAYSNVFHPGYRGKKVAQRSMRAAEWEVLADVVDQIDLIINGSSAA